MLARWAGFDVYDSDLTNARFPVLSFKWSWGRCIFSILLHPENLLQRPVAQGEIQGGRQAICFLGFPDNPVPPRLS